MAYELGSSITMEEDKGYDHQGEKLEDQTRERKEPEGIVCL
jgi:hypothetical protein